MSAGPPPSVVVVDDLRIPRRMRPAAALSTRPPFILQDARLHLANRGVVVPAVLEVRVKGRVLAPNGQDHGQYDSYVITEDDVAHCLSLSFSCLVLSYYSFFPGE